MLLPHTIVSSRLGPAPRDIRQRFLLTFIVMRIFIWSSSAVAEPGQVGVEGSLYLDTELQASQTQDGRTQTNALSTVRAQATDRHQVDSRAWELGAAATHQSDQTALSTLDAFASSLNLGNEFQTCKIGGSIGLLWTRNNTGSSVSPFTSPKASIKNDTPTATDNTISEGVHRKILATVGLFKAFTENRWMVAFVYLDRSLDQDWAQASNFYGEYGIHAIPNHKLGLGLNLSGYNDVFGIASTSAQINIRWAWAISPLNNADFLIGRFASLYSDTVDWDTVASANFSHTGAMDKKSLYADRLIASNVDKGGLYLAEDLGFSDEWTFPNQDTLGADAKWRRETSLSTKTTSGKLFYGYIGSLTWTQRMDHVLSIMRSMEISERGQYQYQINPTPGGLYSIILAVSSKL